jgi:aspartate aminotransferase
MPHSSIRRLFNAAKALEEQGVEVIRLDIGDPNFELPERMGAAIKAAIDAGKTHYSPMPGLPALRRAIAQHVSRKLDLADAASGDTLPWDRVVCSQGATQALNACFQLSCSAGDSAILPQIYFPNYMQQLCLGGIRPQFYAMDETFQPVPGSLGQLDAAAASVLLINSPSNPTGAVFPPDTMRELYGFARSHGLWIISDEAYTDYIYDTDTLSPLQLDWELPEEERRVLAVFSFSKSYAATGLRMGWTICPNAAVAQQLGLMNEPLTGSLTTPLQEGMLAALAEDDTRQRRDTLRALRDRAVEILAANGIDAPAPRGGIFFLLDISGTGLSGDEFADRLLAEEHVSVVPGSGFGLQPAPGAAGTAYVPSALAARCIRLCFARPEQQLLAGVERIAAFIKRQSA